MRPIFWMCHPLSGGIAENLKNARAWMHFLLRAIPAIDIAADWILWCEILDDEDPADRVRGIEFDANMIRRLSGVVLVGGRISTGMASERDAALAAFGPGSVVDLTFLGRDVPSFDNVKTINLVCEAFGAWLL